MGASRHPRFEAKMPTPDTSSTSPGTLTPTATGATPGTSPRWTRASAPIDATIAPAGSAGSIGVGVRLSPSTRPSAPMSADFVSVPPTSNASTGVPEPSGPCVSVVVMGVTPRG